MSDHWMWRDVPPVLFLGADWQGEFALSRIRGSAALRTRLRAFERASARQEPRLPGASGPPESEGEGAEESWE